jgi:hypothetical protein
MNRGELIAEGARGRALLVADVGPAGGGGGAAAARRRGLVESIPSDIDDVMVSSPEVDSGGLATSTSVQHTGFKTPFYTHL